MDSAFRKWDIMRRMMIRSLEKYINKKTVGTPPALRPGRLPEAPVRRSSPGTGDLWG